jgi:hypothetical protein
MFIHINAFVHLLYHTLVNDPYITDSVNCIRHPAIVQSRAEDVCKSILHFFDKPNAASQDLPSLVRINDVLAHPISGEPQPLA